MRGSNWLGWLGAVGVMLLSVFLITFFTNFSPVKAPQMGDIPTQNANKLVNELSFVSRQFPNDPSLPPNIQEYGVPGSHDFWFTNENKTPVTFGLDRKNCTCSSVEVFLVQADWLKNPEAKSLAGGKEPTAADLSKASGNPVLVKLESSIQSTALENSDGVKISVPAGGIGWIRLRFKNDKMGPINLFANFWLDQVDSGVFNRLDIRNDVAPMFVATPGEARVGLLSKQKPVGTSTVIAFSGTRKKLNLVAESKVKKSGSDIIQVSPPVQLTPAELADVTSRMKVIATVGYRFEVRASLPAEGDTQTEFGPFLRPFRIQCPDLPENDPMRSVGFNVSGAIESDVRVLGANPEGIVDINNFPWDAGKKARIRIETSNPEVKLEIDNARTAPFLKIRQVGEPEKLRGGASAYDYEIEVPSRKMRGAFPREETDPGIRDSAFYIRSVGSKNKLIRVPVMGRADE